MFRNKLFRSAIIGSSLFRIGVGATPFLLPLMLQLSFGLTPFESGLITFIGALGAITSKFIAEKVFAAGGFPRVLMTASVLGCVLLGVNGFFTPETPPLFIYLVLLVTGLIGLANDRGTLSAATGSFYDGTLTELGWRGRVELTSRFYLEPNLSWNRGEMLAGTFTTVLASSRVTYALSPRMFVSTLARSTSSWRTSSTASRGRCSTWSG